MSRMKWLAVFSCLAMTTVAGLAQPRTYIGYVYPAGGQQGTTFEVKLGGQGLDEVTDVIVTGKGVKGTVVEYNRALNPQEITLLNEQLRQLKKQKPDLASTMMAAEPAMMMMTEDTMMSSGESGGKKPPGQKKAAVPRNETQQFITKIQKRLDNYVNRPASASLAHIVYVEITIAPNAEPGRRELRLVTPRGVSNPMVFYVGQLPETSRTPMKTSPFQVLGKEELALRKRPDDEVEKKIKIPCTLNGQVASGEKNLYRFQARKGQRLVITTKARELIPFIADAVPGWFQPVLAIYDKNGAEVAYEDDYRFCPDPTLLFEVPADGEYVLEIYDAIFRGREDFVYRVTIGELPFITGIFPLGARTNTAAKVKLTGWNLEKTEVDAPGLKAGCDTCPLTTRKGKWLSNPVSFARDTLPEIDEQEDNDTPPQAQKVTLPVIVNGRIQQAGDWDVFHFRGKSNETVVVDVQARRLDSPLDSILKLTDIRGKPLAFNDDHEDPTAGINTHHADSYLMARLPADGTYYVHLGDAARNAGEAYGYRLRISPPQPDFELRTVPSTAILRRKSSTAVSVHLVRKDGFTAPVKVTLKDPPEGFTANTLTFSGTQQVARLTIRTTLESTDTPVDLRVVGTAKLGKNDLVHEAVPAEDRMQAFLWRHLVPAADLKAVVYDPAYKAPPKRVPPERPPAEPKPQVADAKADDKKPKFSKQQVAGRLRQLKALYEEGLLTDDFHAEKVAECEAAL